jgi:uncharacterized protein
VIGFLNPNKSYLCIMSSSKKTLVLGASENPARYSYLAVQRLQAKGHPVIALGRAAGHIGDISIQTGKENYQGIDTVTLYLNPLHQQEYYDYILSLHPKRLIFNPGTENEELFNLAAKQGIVPIEACTLVMLSTSQF